MPLQCRVMTLEGPVEIYARNLFKDFQPDINTKRMKFYSLESKIFKNKAL